MKRKNWPIGMFLLVAAVMIIVNQVGSFVEIGFWSIFATVFIAIWLIQSIIKREPLGIILSAALLYWIYQAPLSLPYITPWMLILAAALAGVGLHILFGRKYIHSPFDFNEGFRPEPLVDGNEDDNHPYAKVKFGASSRYLHADNLESGQFHTAFGALEVFLDQSQPCPAGANFYVDCSFGSIKFYVPKHWQVVNAVKATLGAVECDSRFQRVDENSPKLILNGYVQFGAIEIQFV